MLNRFTISSLIALFFAGCASYTPQQVDQQIAYFKGYELSQLIAAWGVPNKQYELNDQYWVEWVNQDKGSNSSLSLGSGGGGKGWFGGIGVTLPLDSEKSQCVRRAVTDQNRQQIVQLSWQGDSDFCGELLARLVPKADQKKK